MCKYTFSHWRTKIFFRLSSLERSDHKINGYSRLQTIHSRKLVSSKLFFEFTCYKTNKIFPCFIPEP